jgi:LuxR family maltose regulon positive regulatory protein
MSAVANSDPSLAGSAPWLVVRRRLFERLSLGAELGVTLVSASPGSGKTVLLRSWIDDSGLVDHVAWVTVEPGERIPERLWSSVVEQLRAVAGVDAQLKKSAPSPDFDGLALVDRLVSELGSLEEPVVLVIDDLHELTSTEACAQLERLLAHRPSSLRVILATRHGPELGLHRQRLSGGLVEIGESELRFTFQETRQLLTTAGIELSDEGTALLYARTEGWVAGVRLAALAGQQDPEGFVARFSGSDRAVGDYLLAEVLERKADEVKRLLIRTSILDRVNGALADVLVGRSDSERVLLALAEENTFVVCLDAEGSWFRYDPFFLDFLRLELRRRDPSTIPGLHRAAAGWYGEHGYVIEALTHAQAAEDWTHAANLLAEHGLGLVLDGHPTVVRALIREFPSYLRSQPELTSLFALCELTAGCLDDAAAYIAIAEHYAHVVPVDRRSRFEATLAMARLGLARACGDFEKVSREVERLRDLSDVCTAGEIELSHDAWATAQQDLGIVELWLGRSEEAERHLQQGLKLARRIGRPYVEVSCLSHLAVLFAQRSYEETRKACAEARAVASEHGWTATPSECVALGLMGIISVAQGRFEEAQELMHEAEQAARPDLDPAAALLVQLGQGMVHLAFGRLEQALSTLRVAVDLQTMLVGPHVLTMRVQDLLAYAQLGLGDTAGIRATLAGVSAEEREQGRASLVSACLHLAEKNYEAVADTLAPVLGDYTPLRGEMVRIDALLIDAIARDRLGDGQTAEYDIEQALDLAEPNGLIFPFVVVPVRELLERIPAHRTAHAGLLADILDVLGGSALPSRGREPFELDKDLSERELRILRFLPSNLSAPEIGAQLYLSTSTIKTHMRHLYAKLGVHTRTKAVERGRCLALLGPSARFRS